MTGVYLVKTFGETLSIPNWLKSFTAGDECRFSFCDKELAKVNLADPQVLCN